MKTRLHITLGLGLVLAALPWVGAGLRLLRDPTRFFADARRALGDTYVVDAFGFRLFCVFSAAGVRGLLIGETLMRSSDVGGAMSDAWNSISSFIGKVCFAHAIGNAVESSRKSLSVFNYAVEEAMNNAYGTIKSFGAELKATALGPTSAAVGSTAAGSQTLVLAPTFNFPEGSIAPQDPREFAEAVYNELSAIVRRDLRAQTFFVAR